ncbi:hypothetical protein C4573_03800 [Candidatus Woesearchaeota archaeon]|nr:MAG: hypothetical protein C4573_03800 [Candidatus Woesearchaeota archaeon]
MKTNYQHFLDLDVSPYVGEWILIDKQRVIGHSKNILDLKKKIKAVKGTPFIAKIPEEETLIF